MNKVTPNHRSLTIKSNGGLVRVLIMPVRIFISYTGKYVDVQAIWDTGASGSVVTSNLVHLLGLTPTGVIKVNTAGGLIDSKTYTIDMAFPNGVKIGGIIASEAPSLSSGVDVLIGMDIISMGDFSITNHKGVTCMSFRVPSQHEIDYVKNPTYGLTPIKHIPPGGIGSNTIPKKKKRK